MRAWLSALGAGAAFLLSARAAHGAGTDFDLAGRFNFDWAAENEFRDRDLDKQAVLNVETDRKADWRAVLEAGISSEGDTLTLREMYLDWKPKREDGERGELRLRVGQDRKRFGIEWSLSQEERLALTRGEIYHKLARLAFVGRDSQVALRFDDRTEVSIHSSDGLNGAALFRRTLAGDPDADEAFTSHTLLQSDRIESRWVWTGAEALSYQSWRGGFRLQLEGFFGKDAPATDLAARSGDSGNVFFAAGTVSAALQERMGIGAAPYARVSYVLNDLSDLGDHTLELCGGLRYYLLKRLALGAEVRGVWESFRGQVTPSTSSQALVSLRYYFGGRSL